MLLTLIKILIVIMVFPALNFLVIMLVNVVNEILYLMLMFIIFSFMFALCYHICNVDTSMYGRAPSLFGNLMSVLRASMGEFAMLDIF